MTYRKWKYSSTVPQHENWTLPLFGLPAQVWFFFGLSADKPMKCDFYNITYLDFYRCVSLRMLWPLILDFKRVKARIRQCRYRGNPCRYVRDVWTNKSDLIMYTNQRRRSGLKIWFGCCLRTAYSSVLILTLVFKFQCWKEIKMSVTSFLL